MKIAVITGASSGLGKEYVRQLDIINQKTKEYDEIWVIARRLNRLEAMQIEIKTSLRPILLDLSSSSAIDSYEFLLQEEKPDIRLLINCAGYGRVGNYADISRTDSENMINLNCRAAVAMTIASIPYMKSGAQIAEVCSMVGFLPLSYMNIYAASKSFLLRYSRALQVELKASGITVTAVCPYWVKDTEFIGKSKESKDSSYVTFYKGAGTTEKSVSHAIRDIRKGKAVSTPSFVSKLMRFLTAILPDTVILWGWERIRN